ncbi:MAG TPA: hypothetical protein PK718_03870 [Candidatus Methanofastidiosa archaeon]|nr:hypothetical protein [Candidatus Methanofastidiosa archaeon]HPR41670.1 hypothetical protein [Candidatus Methanofastidiosa archaeon]
MTRELVCAYCGKNVQEEAMDADEITYIIDPEDRKVVCFECLHYNAGLKFPTVTFYPGEEETFIAEMYAGTDKILAKWVSLNKYKGDWDICSEEYEKLETDDADAKISELKGKGAEFAVVNNNGKIGVWIKK